MAMRYLVCITGASGALYSLRLMSALAWRGVILHFVASQVGRTRALARKRGRPLGYWLGKLRLQGGPDGGPALITMHDSSDFSAPIASGSFRLNGTVIAPRSMGTLGFPLQAEYAQI
jgi:3-polyprenyl-4-hydroxybenzoate decarboxylase